MDDQFCADSEVFYIGQIVHYVLPTNNKHRPAIVVHIWDRNTGLCNLNVFLDYGEPELFNGELSQIHTSVIHNEDEKAPGTWHFIDDFYVENKEA